MKNWDAVWLFSTIDFRNAMQNRDEYEYWINSTCRDSRFSDKPITYWLHREQSMKGCVMYDYCKWLICWYIYLYNNYRQGPNPSYMSSHCCIHIPPYYVHVPSLLHIPLLLLVNIYPACCIHIHFLLSTLTLLLHTHPIQAVYRSRPCCKHFPSFLCNMVSLLSSIISTLCTCPYLAVHTFPPCCVYVPSLLQTCPFLALYMSLHCWVQLLSLLCTNLLCVTYTSQPCTFLMCTQPPHCCVRFDTLRHINLCTQ